MFKINVEKTSKLKKKLHINMNFVIQIVNIPSNGQNVKKNQNFKKRVQINEANMNPMTPCK